MSKQIPTIILITFFFLLGFSFPAFSETKSEEDFDTFTITTYYPSPYGVYNELTTYSNTYLATTDSGNVGIGTSGPQAKLVVKGDAVTDTVTIIGDSSLPDCDSTKRGKQFLLQGASGAEDGLYLCKKKADGSYGWVMLGRVPQGPDTATTKVAEFHNVGGYNLNFGIKTVYCQGAWRHLATDEASLKQYCKERGQTYVDSIALYTMEGGVNYCRWDGSKWVGPGTRPTSDPGDRLIAGVIWCE